jgi:hypothetical protein
LGEGGEREDICYGIVITDPMFGNDAARRSRTSSQVAWTAPGSGWAETMRNMLATMSAAASCSSRASLLTHYATHSLGLGSGGYGVLLAAAGAG